MDPEKMSTGELWNAVNDQVMAAQGSRSIHAADQTTDNILRLFGRDPEEDS